MLKELFSNRLFIGALAFFILSVVGGMLYISHVEKQGAEELATDEDRVKQVTEKQQQQPTAKAPVGDTAQGGHFHADGTWHGEPHDVPMEVVPLSPEENQTIETMDWENLTPKDILYLLEEERWPHLTQAQRELVHREFYAQSLGVEPPPDGYYYRVQSNGHPVLDENGTPKLFKKGEPIFTVKTIIGFAPTREQYRQYKALVSKHDRAYLAGNTAEVERFSALIDELRAEARGKVPLVTSSMRSSPSYPAISEAEHAKRVSEISNQAYRDMGLGYMVDE